MCIDYRQLNNITIKDRYPLPLISELQDRIKGSKIFTKLDLPDAYNFIPIREKDQHLTTFRTRYGSYKYKRMPFGLANAPAKFQDFMNTVLQGYLDEFCTVYLDDILIYSKNEKEHINQVRKVMKRLEEHNLRLRPEKCEFHQEEVEFLGSRISARGITMDPEKVRAIQEWETPGTVKDLQSFLGFANFYRRFIQGYSKITAPLTELTKKEQKYQWTPAAQEAFNELKRQFTTAPILATFDPEKKIIVETDASDRAIGACISQPDEQGRYHPIAFHSRKFTGPELNYDIHDKELLAIIEAFKSWKVYLMGPAHTVEVYTDHKNLLYFTTTKDLNRRQVRWSEFMSQFDYIISYRQGKDNVKADALSRQAKYFQGKEDVSHAMFNIGDKGFTHNHMEAAPMIRITSDLNQRIKDAYQNDELAQQQLEQPSEGFANRNGLLTFNKLIYVPTALQNEVISMNHDEPGAGHQGTDKTLERITRDFYFPGQRSKVNKYIQGCHTCITTKHARHRPYGQMATPAFPGKAWDSVALDFIVKLPKSADPLTSTHFDSILVITDRLTKYGLFVPYLEGSNARQFSHTFIKEIVAKHGLPKEIISDRDKLFTSHFWESLTAQMGIKRKMSTAFHPQTDGQTERLNQTLEQYLRGYINYGQDNWVRLLPMAEFAYNSSKNATTGHSPFYANYGFEPSLVHVELPHRDAPDATLTKDTIVRLQAELSTDLTFLSRRIALYHNRKRSEGPDLTEGDLAYLLRKNIKTKRPSDKLDFTKLGPFKIKRIIKKTNVELELPTTMKIHPVFHVSLIEKAPANTRTPIRVTEPVLDVSHEQLYEVEKILRHRTIRGQEQFLVKWEGYPHSENTWEITSSFQDCPRVLQDYRRSQRDHRGQTPRRHRHREQPE